MKMRRGTKPTSMIVLHVLVAYVIIQFCWWAYLIYDLNSTIYQQKSIIAEMETKQFGNPLMDEVVIDQLLQKQIWMIVGEGSVFLTLLIVGAIIIHRSFAKEISLNRQQKNFLLSITHELNSPIASVKLNLQTLLSRNLEKEKEKQILNGALKEAERLKGLVDNILLATKIDNRAYEPYLEQTDLSAHLKELISSYNLHNKTGHIISNDITEGILLDVDRMAITSILFNLLENAIKYSPKSSKIIVKLRQKDEWVSLSVADQGYGISEADKKNVLQKFYRVGNEETRKSKGTGLGLFIVDFLVKSHDGNISIQDNQPAGTIFEILLKANTNS